MTRILQISYYLNNYFDGVHIDILLLTNLYLFCLLQSADGRGPAPGARAEAAEAAATPPEDGG